MSFEESTHVFLLRVWRERGKNQVGEELWRGSVEHMPSNERVFFQDLRKLCSFVVRKSGAGSMLDSSEGGNGGDSPGQSSRGLPSASCHDKSRSGKP